MGLVYFETGNRRKDGINTEGTEVGAQRARRHPGHTTSLRSRTEIVSPAGISSRSAGATDPQQVRATLASRAQPFLGRGVASGVDAAHTPQAGKQRVDPR